jgi:hypothetical protein
MIADSVNLANAKRRAHEWKLHIAQRKGHMPFEEVGAYLLDEIIRLENLVFAQQKNLEVGKQSPEPAAQQFDPLENFAQWCLGASLEAEGMVQHIIDNARGALEQASEIKRRSLTKRDGA